MDLNACDIKDISIRSTLIRVLFQNIDAKGIESANEEKNKDDRYCAIEKCVRDSVTRAPFALLGGENHVYNGRLYEPFKWSDFYEALRYVLDMVGAKSISHRRMKDLVSSCMMSMMGKRREVDKTVVVMGNGVYDTMSHELKPFSESYYTNLCVNFDYNQNDEPVLWNKFLSEVLPDVELQDLLQEFLAACYVDREYAKIEHMLILKGTGSNGKSVVFETAIALMGADNVSTFSIADLIGARREQNIAAVVGKRLNYCSEIRTAEIGKRNADAFKSLVSGEPTMARPLYKEPFRTTGIPLIMANANNLPTLGEASDSISRRLLIIPFETTIPKEMQNNRLASELRNELSGIFNWVMTGLKRLRDNNYSITIPARVAQIVESYVNDNSSILRWLAARQYYKEWHPQLQATALWSPYSKLYDDFVQWGLREGEKLKTKIDFIKDLDMLGFHKSRRAKGDGIYLYHALTDEEARIANMDIAIMRERKYGVQMLEAEKNSAGEVTVRGIDAVEKYLGLPKDTIWHCFANGYLEGTFRNSSTGQIFNVHKVQEALARSGYYSELKSDEKGLKSKSLQSKRVEARKFNERMRMMGEPFRVFENVGNMISASDRDCILVPFGWEYSVENARKMIEIAKHNSKISDNGNDREQGNY